MADTTAPPALQTAAPAAQDAPAAGRVTGESLDSLIACPSCDALYRVAPPPAGGRSVCARCHRVLIAPRRGAVVRIVGLALTVTILLTAALFLPFLSVRVAGMSNRSSIFDAALAFSGPELAILSVAVTALIVGIPLARMLLVLYTLGPLVAGRAPWRGAARAFRWSEALRPWSMAEIFALGVGVALVKVADLARVEYGPAFWLFAALVVITVLQDGFMCRWSIWHALEPRRTS